MTANKPTDTESAPAEPNTAAPEPSQIPETSPIPGEEDEYGVREDTPVQPTPAATPPPAAVPPTPPVPDVAPMDVELWKRETASDYVSFAEPVIVRFLTNNPTVLPPADGRGRNSYEMDVIQEIDGKSVSKIFGFRSVRLLRLLMDTEHGISPLYGKRIMVTRAGEGMQTAYSVKVLQ